MDSIALKQINDELGKHYGKAIDGRNHFRLVWSEDLLETRKGEFLEEHPILGPNNQLIIIEDVVERIKEVKKYSYFSERYVLEELIFENIPSEIKSDRKGSYEPLYVFQNGDGEPIEPTLQACDMILFYRFNKTLRGHKPTEDELKRKRQEAFREQLEEAIPNSTHKLVHGEAVFLDSTKRREK